MPSTAGATGRPWTRFAAERGEIMAVWDELRERAREESDAVALSPAFRETLDRHGVLMKQAQMFLARPQVFERLPGRARRHRP